MSSRACDNAHVRVGCLVLFVIACHAPARPAPSCAPVALHAPGWAGTNRADLTRWIDSRGCASGSFDPAHPPIALFDWDNTIIKNDTGDAVTFYALAHDRVLRPSDWKDTSRFLTNPAVEALAAACGEGVAGEPLPTRTNVRCADEIFTIYDALKTTGGADAFAGYDPRTLQPAYAWTAQLLAGHTPDELRALTLAAVDPELSAPPGTVQTIGSHRDVTAWLRFYEPQRELIAALRSRGYDVWVITASPQNVIEALAPRVGVDPSHVIGIRSLIANGKLSARLEGCGPVADGVDALIPYVEGKRCWVNKVVYSDRTPHAIERRPDGTRQVFAAGDSDSDAEFVRDATFKLVIDRHKPALMCLALANEGNSWRIQPMFIDPLPLPAAPYACH
jgi:phosphoglycolate phosphatase-like HAD superfamily hydrolase